MKRVRAVEFQKEYILVRYVDEDDPPWTAGHELAINWRKESRVERLAHVAYHVFLLFVSRPDAVAANDEVLQEWIGKLIHEDPGEGHDVP